MGNHALSGIDGFEGRADLFFVDPAKILVVGDWNDRTDFSGETELVESIKAVGVREPLRARKNTAGGIELIAGERRLRAALRARKEGAAIVSVPVILAKRGESEIDLYIDSIIENTGKPLTPTEEANSFKRLIAWGLSVKEIAAKTGRSETLVRSRLDLSSTSPEVKAALDAGEITVKAAEKIARDTDGKVDAQADALEQLKEESKKPKVKPLSLSFKSGSVRYSGGGNFATCQPLADILVNEEFKKSLVVAGYDPETIKISISKKPGPIETQPGLFDCQKTGISRYCCNTDVKFVQKRSMISFDDSPDEYLGKKVRMCKECRKANCGDFRIVTE